ncbi:MAG: riboflavin synthase [Gammaproteobacteria bacterium]
MFTGIVSAVGSVSAIEQHTEDRRLQLHVGELSLDDIPVGASLAVEGVCLSLVSRNGQTVAMDVSAETLRCTTLGGLQPGSRVNLEAALRLNDRLGGHLVSGHVDGAGEVVAIQAEGESMRLDVRAPDALARYICAKGSICINGVSLTVNHVDAALFSVNLVPHTWSVTTLAQLEVGHHVNLEIDMIARYLERLLGDRSL